MIKDDIRKNRPSASSMSRTSNCPGSLNLLRSLPPIAEEEDEQAASGTKIHAALASNILVGLDAEEEEVYDRLRAQEAGISSEWLNGKSSIIIREERLWFPLDLFSGQADVIYKQFSRALVLDFKSIRWGKHAPSDQNPQLRALATLARRRFHTLSEITVGIIQDGHKPTLCVYDEAALEQAETEIVGICNASDDPQAPLHAGDWCGFCPCAARCPALHKEIATTGNALEQRAAELSPTEVVFLWDQCKVVKKAIDSYESFVKRQLEEDPEKYPGLRLKEGTEREKVTDLKTVFARSSQVGVTADQFTDACSITKTNLKSAVKTASALKGKALDAKLEEILDGCTESKRTAASVERVDTPPFELNA